MNCTMSVMVEQFGWKFHPKIHLIVARKKIQIMKQICIHCQMPSQNMEDLPTLKVISYIRTIFLCISLHTHTCLSVRLLHAAVKSTVHLILLTHLCMFSFSFNSSNLQSSHTYFVYICAHVHAILLLYSVRTRLAASITTSVMKS